MMTRDVLLEMEQEEDDDEDGDIGEQGVPGRGPARESPRPHLKARAHEGGSWLETARGRCTHP